MRKAFFKDLQSKLMTIPEIKHVDLWNEQVKYISEEKFAMPAVFVEFTPIPWTYNGIHQRMTNCTIRLHIVTETLAQSSNASTRIDEALTRFDTIDGIVAALSNYAPPIGGTFKHARSITDHDHSSITEDVEEYQVLVKDNAATWKFVEAQIDTVKVEEGEKEWVISD